MHCDDHNKGDSLLAEFGHFQGGGLWIYDMDGAQTHKTTSSAAGSSGLRARFSVVLYTVDGAADMSDDLHKKRLGLGFNPPQRECALPSRPGELLHNEKWTALKDIRFDARAALIHGLYQLGKSAVITLAHTFRRIHELTNLTENLLLRLTFATYHYLMKSYPEPTTATNVRNLLRLTFVDQRSPNSCAYTFKFDTSQGDRANLGSHLRIWKLHWRLPRG